MSFTALRLVFLVPLVTLGQEVGRIVPLTTAAPDYTDGSPANEALLVGVQKLLPAGPNQGFYILEPANRVVRVDEEGLLRSVGFISGVHQSTDRAGNYYYWTGTSLERFALDGSVSTLFTTVGVDFSTALLLRRPTAIVAQPSGASAYLASTDGVFLVGPGVSYYRVSTARSARMLHVKPDGSLVLIDSSGRQVFGSGQLLAGSGEFGLPSDGEDAADAKFSFLSGLASDSTSALTYLLDSVIGSIYQVVDGKVWRVAGNPEGTSPPTEGASARDVKFTPLALDSIMLDSQDRLLIADTTSLTVWRVGSDGLLERAAGKERTVGDITTFAFREPTGLCYDADQNLFVADRKASNIYRLAPDGSVAIVAGNGVRTLGTQDGVRAEDAPIAPTGSIACDKLNGWIYYAEFGQVRRFKVGGTLETVVKLVDQFGNLLPQVGDFAIDSTGQFFFSTRVEIRRFIAQGEHVLVAEYQAPPLGSNLHFTVLKDDSIVVLEESQSTLLRLNSEGGLSERWALSDRPPGCPIANIRALGPVQDSSEEIEALFFNSRAICKLNVKTGQFTYLAGDDNPSDRNARIEDGGLANTASLSGVLAVTDGVVFIESETGRVRRLVN